MLTSLVKRFLTYSSKSVVTVSGPSGVGKTTLINKLLHDYPDSFCHSISYTTRQPRGSEVDGIDYHFTTIQDMNRDIAAGLFLEHAEVHGNLYGTSIQSIQEVLDRNQICILDIDMQGVQQVIQRNINAILILIVPPSIAELRRRLYKRHTDSEETINLRINNSWRELEIARQIPFSYRIINDDLEVAYSEFKQSVKSMLG